MPVQREISESHHHEVDDVDDRDIEDDAVDQVSERAIKEKQPVHHIPAVTMRLSLTRSRASSAAAARNGSPETTSLSSSPQPLAPSSARACAAASAVVGVASRIECLSRSSAEKSLSFPHTSAAAARTSGPGSASACQTCRSPCGVMPA